MSKKVRLGASYLYLGFWFVFSLFPFVWMFVGATNSSYDIVRGKLTFGNQLMENVRWILQYIDIWQCLGNSVIITASIVLLCLLFSSIAGYALEIYHSKGKDRVFIAFLCCMLIPGLTTMIPQYKMMADWGLINNYLACILPAMLSIWHVFLFRQSSRNFPYDLVEAARIDGMGELKIFFKIYFPIMRSTFATGFIVSFMGTWGGFMWSRLVMQKDQYKTLPVALNYVASITTVATNYGAVLVGCAICSLPTLILFLCMQRAFANGVSGSVKG